MKRKHLCQFLRITLLFKEKKPTKKRERVSSLDNTFRIASILQKSISMGRSSYVEMSKVNQIVSFNIKSHLDSIKSKYPHGAHKEALQLFDHLSYCYESTITPNGSIRLRELNMMLSYDSEIASLLDILKKSLNGNTTTADETDYIKNLKNLLREREDFITSIKA